MITVTWIAVVVWLAAGAVAGWFVLKFIMIRGYDIAIEKILDGGDAFNRDCLMCQCAKKKQDEYDRQAELVSRGSPSAFPDDL